ncbi:hypothetical protein WDZ16_11890 [Pseudokineococcus marinus]|uniref:Uncharacterized protein n=1 Tax=Pseudokineococcus marinus TaxID=351215 RepID=A0A849BY55_9ACTN|nr:hypothetical protein [Pseudokineococcus marinus]NNH22458.1 hypothetical protein [Pseudokineococcus marinus]
MPTPTEPTGAPSPSDAPPQEASDAPSDTTPAAEALLRDLLAGTGGWWSTARLAVRRADGLLPAGAARLLLRRPLMGVPAGVRVEGADGRVLAVGLGADLDDDLRALLDPLALVTGLPPAVGALPSSERRTAVARLVVEHAREVAVDGVAAVSGLLSGPGLSGGGLRGSAPTSRHPDADLADVVLDRVSALPLSVGTSGDLPRLALAVEELDARLEDDVFGG